MKKLSALLLLALNSVVHSGIRIDSDGVEKLGSYSVTVPETAAGIAGDSVEIDGLRLEYTFVGTGDDVLFSGLRVEANYDISSPANPGTDTRHGGAGFFETNLAADQQYFAFGIESSIKNTVGASAHANGAPISDINHTKIFNPSNITQNFPAIGTNIRMDFFATSSESVSFSTHAFGYVIRPEAYRSGNTGRIFGWYNPTDRDMQNVNAGNVFKVSVSSAVEGNKTLDLSQACGGALIITSTATITLHATQAFTATNNTIPSSSSTGGSYNSDCEVTIINANLVGGRTITIVDTTDYLPVAAANSVLGALGGSVRVLSYPTAGVWIGLTGVSK